MKTIFLDEKVFLEEYNIKPEDFKKTGLKWDVLINIRDAHGSNMGELA